MGSVQGGFRGGRREYAYGAGGGGGARYGAGGVARRGYGAAYGARRGTARAAVAGRGAERNGAERAAQRAARGTWRAARILAARFAADGA